MADLLTSKRSRGGYRTNAKKIVSFVTKSYAERHTTPPDREQLIIYKNNLERYQAKLEELNAIILSQLKPDEVDDEIGKSQELEDSIWTCLSQILVLQSRTEDNADPSQAQSTSALPVKLPKLELPKFDGDALRWQEFWDSFDSTIHKGDMSNIDKFKYLKSFLTGDAAKLVDGFRLIDANYETVVEVLQQRFGNPEVSIFAHFEHLLALSASGRDRRDLQRTYDECEKHIRSLVALGLEEETFGRVFIPIILSKLPRYIRVELHRRNGSQVWTLNKLRELFKQEITAQQMGDLTLHDTDHTQAQKPQKFQQEPRKQNPSPRKLPPPTNTFVQSNKQASKVTCIFCKAVHFSDQCRKVVSFSDRRKIAQTNNHCFKCLSTKHRIAQCPKKSKCYYCSDTSHHSAFCNKRDKTKHESTMCTPEFMGQVPEQAERQPISIASAAKGTTAFSAVSNGMVYMQMATIRYKGPGGSIIDARLYLDPGSSCSYITTDTAKRLSLKSFGRATVANARFEDRSRSTKSYNCVELSLPTRDGQALHIEAFVTDHISVPLEKLPLSCDRYPILANIPLADALSSKRETVNINILIGGDYYYEIVTGERIKLEDGLILLGSKFGYIAAEWLLTRRNRSPRAPLARC